MVPITFEGWQMLHDLFRVDWQAWAKADSSLKKECVEELQSYVSERENLADGNGHSACFSILGHKGDLLVLHFRHTLEELSREENCFASLKISEFLTRSHSYVSHVELGMYEFTMKLSNQLESEGLKEDSEEWNEKWNAALAEQKERIKGRLYTDVPDRPYICFYPMDKKRNDVNNWYDVDMEKRQLMMREHGMIGRKYAGKVNQIISGSIGFDDWEWGVDLFADDPIVFKKLVYEMRFDKASSLMEILVRFGLVSDLKI